jgi:hypothetical protein
MSMPPTHQPRTAASGHPDSQEVARFIHEHTARRLTSEFRLGKIHGNIRLSSSVYNGNSESW